MKTVSGMLTVILVERKPVSEGLERRTWVYVQSPTSYGIAPCSCGNVETQWSEFKKHLWCATCEKDFIPEHNGIFDGPIPVKTAQMLGLSFDRFNLETEQIEKFEEPT